MKPPGDVSTESRTPSREHRTDSGGSRGTYSEGVPHFFDADVVAAVLRHMNDDHAADNVLIARAFAAPSGGEVTDAVMTRFDGEAGVWRVTRSGTAGSATAGSDAAEELRVPWPGGAITARAEVRREIVALYDAACARLGVTSRPHA